MNIPIQPENKLIITHWKNQVLTALISEKAVLELSLADDSSVLGNIYIGKVKKIVKNLNSAFVDYGLNQTGYYSLTDNPETATADGQRKALREGDEILVQIAKEAVKTKDPVLSSNLNFTGKYAVLTSANRMIGFSTRITDRAWKDSLRPKLEEILGDQAGMIVRTNAYQREEELFREITYLMNQYQAVLRAAPYRTCYSLLYHAEPGYIRSLKSAPKDSLSQIITDDAEIFDKVREYLTAYQPEDIGRLRLYQDHQIDLIKVYALEAAIRQATQKRVWLKSGGYLVIEPTEAMVVIDVNTGKYAGNQNLAGTIRRTNREAAEEICHQLRLRNLSGIIMIDFIDMKEEEDRQMLMHELKAHAARDQIKTTVVDMTPLGLVEMTRKKERRPLHEQIALLVSDSLK
ncbi:MAG: ribonuclease E/G [Clostridiales bacterium]|nr:ribonuclease E/G [Clostridiales bacterium]